MSVFTPVSYAELAEHLRRYPVGALLGYQGIGEGVENSNFFVDTEDGRWVLTLFERTEEDGLPYYLGLMDHLGAHGFVCPAPLHTRDGALITRLNGRPAALVRRLPGNSVLFPTLGQCAAVGEVLGELHQRAASFDMQRVNGRGAAWREATGTPVLDRVEPAQRQLIEDELAAQAQLDLAALPHGPIHADLFRDNVLFVDQRISGVIDFYYACNDAWLYDLAVTVNDWCSDADGRINHARAGALIGAWCARHEPGAAERAAWPLVTRAAALRFWLSRLHDWHLPRQGELVHVKDPEPYRRILVHLRDDGPPPLA
jgi:homoserine kinase (EC 2.7.1.39)